MRPSSLCSIAAAACLLAATANPLAAQTFLGTTVGGPTWNRPIGGTPPTLLSGVGTAVAFNVFSFTVSAAGSYSFLSTATGPAWDNYLFLYRDSFSPTDQFTNVLIGNDDFGAIGLSGFDFDLLTSVTYLAVTSGFANDDAGTFSLRITGPGTAIVPSVVPEPSTYAMLGSGLLLLVIIARRRRLS